VQVRTKNISHQTGQAVRGHSGINARHMLSDELLAVFDVVGVDDIGLTVVGVFDTAGCGVDGDADYVRRTPGEGREAVEELGLVVGFVGGEKEPHCWPRVGLVESCDGLGGGHTGEDGSLGPGADVEVGRNHFPDVEV